VNTVRIASKEPRQQSYAPIAGRFAPTRRTFAATGETWAVMCEIDEVMFAIIDAIDETRGEIEVGAVTDREGVPKRGVTAAALQKDQRDFGT